MNARLLAGGFTAPGVPLLPGLPGLPGLPELPPPPHPANNETNRNTDAQTSLLNTCIPSPLKSFDNNLFIVPASTGTAPLTVLSPAPSLRGQYRTVIAYRNKLRPGPHDRLEVSPPRAGRAWRPGDSVGRGQNRAGDR